MHHITLLPLLVAAVVAVPLQCEKSPTWIPGPTTGTDLLAKEGLLKLATYLETDASCSRSNNSCTLSNAQRRKEWDDLIPTEKKAYIKAVRCLQTLPARSGESAPGARSRYDDFVAVHMDGTGSKYPIHSTGNFLTWHRYFLWTFEEALRNECNYPGYQPYVKLGRYSNDVIGAPLFDGSDTSISGNGINVPHGPIGLNASLPNATYVEIPAVPGGGCVTSGPFVNYTITLGPVRLASINNTNPNPLPNGKGFNPRCFRRSLNVVSASGASDANCTKLITSFSDIGSFQNNMQGPFAYGIPEYGVHASAHYLVGGDPGGDFFASPGDPFFWFLHAEIDRLWWIWQIQDFGDRVDQIAGTLTSNNIPPSRELTLDDVVELGVLDGSKGIRIRDAVDTMGGPFCYIYE